MGRAERKRTESAAAEERLLEEDLEQDDEYRACAAICHVRTVLWLVAFAELGFMLPVIAMAALYMNGVAVLTDHDVTEQQRFEYQGLFIFGAIYTSTILVMILALHKQWPWLILPHFVITSLYVSLEGVDVLWINAHRTTLSSAPWYIFGLIGMIYLLKVELKCLQYIRRRKAQRAARLRAAGAHADATSASGGSEEQRLWMMAAARQRDNDCATGSTPAHGERAANAAAAARAGHMPRSATSERIARRVVPPTGLRRSGTVDAGRSFEAVSVHFPLPTVLVTTEGEDHVVRRSPGRGGNSLMVVQRI